MTTNIGARKQSTRVLIRVDVYYYFYRDVHLKIRMFLSNKIIITFCLDNT